MISNFLDITLGTVDINKVLLGNRLIWVRDRGLAKDYPGTGWYKATDTGTIYCKGVPRRETHIFPGDPTEYISVSNVYDAKSYANRAATSNVTNMREMIEYDSSFNEDISHWDVSNVTDMSGMFQNALEFNQDISSWDVSNVTGMYNMFFNAYSFNQDISSWDVSKVTGMSGMFAYANSFNQDISLWDTSNVTAMNDMFESATSFNQDLSGWCVPLIGTSPKYFDNGASNWTLPKPVWGTCPRGEDGTIGLAKDYSGTGWYKATDTGTVFSKDVPEGETHIFGGDPIEYISVYSKEDAMLYAVRAATSNVTNMSIMFVYDAEFNEDISHWDVSNVTTMSYMFNGAISFNQDLSSWNTSNVTNMSLMFYEATSFNGDISSWDTSKVTDMSDMFRDATSFNQDLSTWDTSSVTNMISMFENATVFNQDLSGWCVPLIEESPYYFDDITPNWTLPRPVWGTCPRGENTPD